MEITAVAAFPDDRLLPGENGVGFDMFQEGAITLFVMTFGNANGVENFSDSGEAFLTGDFGKAGVETVPFVVFALGGGGEIGGGGADDTGGEIGVDIEHAALEEFEKAFSVFFFLVGGFGKNGGNLHKTVFFGAGRKIGVAVAGLGFSGKALQEIAFSTAAS